MKIKIIDLFNKIANNEKVPKKIKLLCDDEIFIYEKEKDDYIGENDDGLFNECILDTISLEIYLNDEVEIIEEPKKIEKIKSNGDEFYSDYIDTWISKNKTDTYCEFLMNKINELIDAVNELKRDK